MTWHDAWTRPQLERRLAGLRRDLRETEAAIARKREFSPISGFEGLFAPPDPDYSCGAAYCDDPACNTHNGKEV